MISLPARPLKEVVAEITEKTKWSCSRLAVQALYAYFDYAVGVSILSP